MSIVAPGSAQDIAALERPSGPQPIPVLAQTPLGAVLAGTLNGDVIIVSAQALALLRAGAFIRALVLRGIESARRTLTLAATRTLTLECGMYRVS